MQTSHVEIVEFMISRGCSIKLRNGGYSYVLHGLVHHGREDLIKILLKKGASLYEPCDLYFAKILLNFHPQYEDMILKSYPAAVSAIILSKLNILGLFLETGLNPNTRIFNSSSTLLHLACERNDINAARLLIKFGADTNSVNSQGKNPFYYLDIGLADQLKDIFDENIDF